MLPQGRGAIAHVHYTGEEAASEIKKLLDAVIANEDEFEPWEALVVRASELEGGVTRNSSPSSIELLRNVFDCFLAKFPLFFGYWKKYADFEFSIGGTETAEMVYERGVSCIPSSVDLWKDYCAFKFQTCHDNDVIRELFERAAEFVGIDFQSGLFWDKYIEFEERAGDHPNLTKIFERLMHIPTYQFDRYYHKFRSFIGVRPVEEVVPPEKLTTLKEELATEVPGLSAKPELEQERALVDKIHAYYYNIYVQTQSEVSRRWQFEGNIKRSYFHVTDVDDDELSNWRKYLDFEEAEGDFKRISFLYERCLVACALYEEFWLRYARWMFAQGKDEDTRIIYIKASCIFVPIAHPTVRLHWARFEENLGAIDVADAVHRGILEELPGHVETIISLAGLLRRHKGEDAAIAVLQEYIQISSSQVAGRLIAEQARILWQCSKKAKEAQAVYHNNYETYPESEAFWLNYLEFEINQPSSNEDESHDRIKQVHEMMRSKSRLSAATKKDLSRIYMEYLLNRGGTKAAKEYMLLDKEVNGATTIPSMKAKASTETKKHNDEASNGQMVM